MSGAEITAGDVKRLFLQAIISRGIISQKVAKLLWKKCIDAVNACNATLQLSHSDDWDAFVTKINRSIDKLDLEFRSIKDETSGKTFYALVNRKDDEIAQLATDYTPVEISFFKAVIERIMLAPRESFSVSSLAALREMSVLKLNITKSQGEVLLASFVAKGWLTKSKRGRYSLAMRSSLELLPYLKSTYPDEILECTICMEFLTRGIACPTPNCKSRLHYHCFGVYRRNHHTCPSCSRDWPREAKEKPLLPVGEEAACDGDDSRRRTRQSAQGESDEEVAWTGDEEEGTESSQPPTQAKADRKRKGKQTAILQEDTNMDEDTAPSQPSQPTRRRSSRR